MTAKEVVETLKQAIDLIESQQAKINKLEKARQKQGKFLAEERMQKYELINKLSTAKDEAYKEFAEKIKKSIKENVDEAWHRDDGNGIYDAEYVLDDIDNLLKEMVGEKEWPQKKLLKFLEKNMITRI